MLQQKWKKTLKLGLYVKCFTTQPVFKIKSHPALWITSDVFYIHKFAKNHNASCAIERNQGNPKTYLQSVFPSGSVQAHRYSFQRCRNLKRKKMTGYQQCRRGWEKKTARCVVCRNSTCAPKGRVQVFESWIKRTGWESTSSQLCFLVLLPSPWICVRVVWSGHFSPMGDLALNSDAPPPVASVPSLQVTLTAPLMHIH